MKTSYSQHHDLTSIVAELKDFEKVANTLRNKLEYLDGQEGKERAMVERIREYNERKREILSALNKENMQISYEIEEIMD